MDDGVTDRAITADDLRGELDALALGGVGWSPLLERLAAVTQRRVRLVAADGALLGEALPLADGPTGTTVRPEDFDRFHATRIPMVAPADMAALLPGDDTVTVRCHDGARMRGVAVRAGRRRVGAVLVELPGAASIDAFARAAVTAVAIEAVRRDVRAAAVAESAAWLVDELRFGSRRDADELSRLARRHGLTLAEPHAAAVIAYDGADDGMWATSLSWLETPVRIDGARAWTVIGGDVGREARLIHARLAQFLRGPVLVGTGAVVIGAHAIRESFEQATAALALVRRRPGETVAVYDELGLIGLLLSVPRARLESFVDRRLGPLLGREDLLDTLAAWYASGGSRAAVAGAVSIHRNSVGYRMSRIRDLLGVDPLAPEAAVELQAALAALECVAALRADADLAEPPGRAELCSQHEAGRTTPAEGHDAL